MGRPPRGTLNCDSELPDTPGLLSDSGPLLMLFLLPGVPFPTPLSVPPPTTFLLDYSAQVLPAWLLSTGVTYLAPSPRGNPHSIPGYAIPTADLGDHLHAWLLLGSRDFARMWLDSLAANSASSTRNVTSESVEMLNE